MNAMHGSICCACVAIGDLYVWWLCSG